MTEAASNTYTSAADEMPPHLVLENHLGGDDAPNYRDYQYDLIAPHCGQSMLEIGAGLGEFSEQFLDRRRLVLTDTEPFCLRRLTERFGDRANVEVRKMFLPEDVALDEPVETVVAVNVLEHIADDIGTLRALATVLAPGGRIVLWVPAYEALYGDFDDKVGHVRRYTPKTMARAVAHAGLTVVDVRAVNLLGGLAWWAAVRRGGVSTPNRKLVRIYDKTIIPATRRIESIVKPPFGQTVLCVAARE